ncbi:MAG: hypothetical protein AB7E37_00520 [Candidatus Altimarinota bacterium]
MNKINLFLIIFFGLYIKIFAQNNLLDAEYIPESKKDFLFTFLGNPIIIIFFVFFLGLLGYWYSLFQNNKREFKKVTPKKTPKEIIFPEVTSESFNKNIHEIFITYLEEKFYGKDFYYKTLSEIANEIDKTDFPQIHEIILLLQKVKYSSDTSQKKLLLEKLQQIIKPH